MVPRARLPTFPGSDHLARPSKLVARLHCGGNDCGFLPLDRDPEGRENLVVTGMPLGRYFAFAGSLLLLLLFVADWYMPKLAVAPARADADKAAIRIHSDHQWPEAIVFDTNLPTIVPAPAMVAAASATEKSPNDAFAQATELPQATAVTPAKPAAAAAVTPKRVAERRRAKLPRVAAGRVVSDESTFFRNTSPWEW
jgi:hypothetical protein